MNKQLFLIFLLLNLCTQALGQTAQNIILVTIDGLRWQEVFHGMDAALANHPEYSERTEVLQAQFAGEPSASARALMPFLHNVVFRQGAVIGNRTQHSCARVTNPWYFSYPGYNEILTGYGDPAIDSNRPILNPNITFMEWLQINRDGFTGKVAAFASWNVFPYIFNSERSGIPVNVGKKPAPATMFEAFLNTLHDEIPSPWETVRLDAFTHHYALSAMASEHPRVLFIGYGETDDFAHDGQYDQYLLAANRTDRFLREVWEQAQADPYYRDKTVLFITVDHGRGDSPLETWQHHASKASLQGYMQSLAAFEEGIVGSDAVWMAAIGPGIRSAGLIPTPSGCVGSNQVAATLLRLLGQEPTTFNARAGQAIDLMLESP